MIRLRRKQPAVQTPPWLEKAPPRGRRSKRWLIFGSIAAILAFAAVVLSVLLLWGNPFDQAANGPTTVATVGPRLIARGEIRPVARARVGALAAGVVRELPVDVGDKVAEQQEIARIRGATGTEVVTAPWRGTVMSVPVKVGDTVSGGSTVAVIGDLSRLQIETTDVDEFIISYIERGHPVTATVDAVGGKVLRGFVRSVTLEAEKNDNGDDHYPIVIELPSAGLDLRAGMSVRVNFAPTPVESGATGR